MELKSSTRLAFEVERKFNFTYDQREKLIDSALLKDILVAAQYERWDQVTLMLYQEHILVGKGG